MHTFNRSAEPKSKRARIPEDIVIQKSTPPRIVQTAPIFKLADETFLHILSYLKCISLRHDTLPLPFECGPPSIAEKYIERQLALRGLTQTCRVLRQKFLPWYYERVEACVPTSDSPQWYRTIGELLYSRSRSLRKSPHVAQSVRVISVSITRYQTEWVLPAFSACLVSLPNLHTIEIYYAHSNITTAIKNAFKGCLLPSVQTAVLPAVAHNILRCCPNARDVTCSGGVERVHMLSSAIVARCPKVERVSWLCLPEESWNRLAKVRPNIKHIQLITTVEMDWSHRIVLHPRLDEIKLLGGFKHLSTIEVVYRYINDSSVNPKPRGGDQVMAEAVAVLKKSQHKEAKYACVRVIEADSSGVGGQDVIRTDTTEVSEVWEA